MKLELYSDAGKRVQYRLVEPFTHQGITVPAGFLTDFGSVPTLLEWVVSGEDRHIVYPSIVHDYIYRNLGDIPEGTYTRRKADDMLRDGMREAGASWAKANAVWLAVRLGGWNTWRKAK